MAERKLSEGERIAAVQQAFVDKLNQVLDFIPGYRGYRKAVENNINMLQEQPNNYSTSDYARDLGYSIVPFYGAYDNYVNDQPQDWKGNALEAVLIGLPVKGVRGANRQIDKAATEQYNNYLAKNIREQAPAWKQEDLLKVTEERPVRPGEFDNLRRWQVDSPYPNRDNIVYASPEGVGGRVEPLEAQTTSELTFNYPFGDEVTQSTGWAIPRGSLANKQYSPTEYLDRWKENYALRNPEVADFNKGVAKIYSPDVMRPNITNIERRLLGPDKEYNYTINEIRDANSTLSKAAATDYANSTIFKYKDEYINKIARVDPAAAENLNNMYNSYLETLVSDMPYKDKAIQLQLISEDINAEINMFNLLNKE